MQQKFLQQAHADLPVYLTDVYRDFQKTGTRPFHLRLTLYDGTARSFPLQLPPADCTEEAAFLAEYIHAFLYNLLSSLGARAVDLYFDPADQALQALVATLPEVFQLHTPRLQRTGYGKCLNVNDRILTALLPDAEGFSFRTHPLCDEPEAQSLPVCTGASVLSRLPARATHALLLGIDVGGTDIKLCASVNGDLCVFKEFDWFPAAFTQADQLTEPIVFLTRLLRAAASLAACGKKSDSGVKILVPNDTTNEARALLLLQENGIITLKDGAGITATKNDIVDNPYNVEIVEAEAAQLPSLLADAEYAVINSNYAINAGLNPVKDSLLIEGSASAYANILAVKEGTENTDAVKALKAALESQQVVDYINEKYDGSVVSVVTDPTDGYDASVNYDALNGTTISIAASPTPHAEILEVAKQILAAKGVTLDIQVYNDYVVPNTVVDDGTVTANYFQHLPYLEDFNAQNNTHIVSVGGIHVEPMGLYGGKQTTLDAISGK